MIEKNIDYFKKIYDYNINDGRLSVHGCITKETLKNVADSYLFFRDILNGPLYIVTTIISVILIMAIIGYLMEKKKIDRDLKSKVAVIETPSSNPVDTITPYSWSKVINASPDTPSKHKNKLYGSLLL